MKKSAGLLVYRYRDGALEVFLAHPGGPFWAKKDQGAWSIPKGEFDQNEEPLKAALREFAEEIGQPVAGEFVALTPHRQPGGKLVFAWAVAGDIDADHIVSNEFEMEWPPRSGRRRSFPEVDRAAWFSLDEARQRMQPGQLAILEEFAEKIAHK